MKIFSLFRSSHSKSINIFAEDLANEIARRYPPELDTSNAKRPSQNRLVRILEDTCQQVVEYQLKEKLGWMRKAQLANTFKWSLKEKGYSEAFVDLATEAIVVHLSK